MAEQKVLSKTKLRIKNQGGLLNQISSVYSSFFRAGMEYVDNAIDAAEGLRRTNPAFVGKIAIEIDLAKKLVTFSDNCGGMSPEQLLALMDSVGESSKKTVPWANGQFGYGVHAFRGFARYATFASHKKGFPAAEITIDRDASDTEEVALLSAKPGRVKEGSTVVTISSFDPHHFKKNQFIGPLISEVERHFDDVLRAGIVEVWVGVVGQTKQKLDAFDYDSMPGISVKDHVPVLEESGKSASFMDVDLRLLEKMHQTRPAVLTNKGRRIQPISELKSYRRYAIQAGRSANVWTNPFLTGSIEINDIVLPVLTRDDLKDTSERGSLYAAILETQLRIEELVRERQQKRRQEAYEELASKVSECLAQVLRKFRIRFDDAAGTANGGKALVAGSDVPFGGPEPGGGGPGPDGTGSGGKPGAGGHHGPGEGIDGAGPAGGSTAGRSDSEPGGATQSGPPRIDFEPFPEEPLRVIPFGSTLTVNIAHSDFIERTSGAEYMDARLASYVAQVLAGPCVEYFSAKRGKMMTPAAVIGQTLELSLHLEEALVASGILEEFVDSHAATA